MAERIVQAGAGESMSMTIAKRKVTVKQVPGKTQGREERVFLQEIEDCMQMDRPRIVLDCSNLHQLDRPAGRLLIRCLEEAMKRNGDVKLAELPMGSKEVMELTGLNRIFETYRSVAEAENSFYEIPKTSTQPEMMAAPSPQESGSAA